MASDEQHSKGGTISTYATPIPGLAGYAGAAALANQAYNNAMARYNQQRSDTLLKYGYTQDAGGHLSVDPNNQYGSYQQMLRSEAGQTQGLERAQAASGWGGSSGFLGAQRENLRYAQGGEQANLGQSLTSALTGISQGEQDAAYNKNAALYQAQETATQNAINNQQFNPGNPPPDAASAVNQAATAAKGTVQWGGKAMNKAQLTAWLKGHGSNLAQWRKNHPAAAKALGL